MQKCFKQHMTIFSCRRQSRLWRNVVMTKVFRPPEVIIRSTNFDAKLQEMTKEVTWLSEFFEKPTFILSFQGKRHTTIIPLTLNSLTNLITHY